MEFNKEKKRLERQVTYHAGNRSRVKSGQVCHFPSLNTTPPVGNHKLEDCDDSARSVRSSSRMCDRQSSFETAANMSKKSLTDSDDCTSILTPNTRRFHNQLVSIRSLNSSINKLKSKSIDFDHHHQAVEFSIYTPVAQLAPVELFLDELKLFDKTAYEPVSVLSTRTCIVTNEANRFVFKKVLIGESLTSGNAKKHFAEYETLLRTDMTQSSANLVKIVDATATADLKWFLTVSEFVEDTLDTLAVINYSANKSLKRKLTNFSQIKHLLVQALGGLDHLHNRLHITHANLKPSNILIVKSTNQLKLTDFGYLHLNQASRYKYLIGRVNNPHNRPYLPIETFRSYKYTQKSDIYAIGAIFYELLFSETYNFLARTDLMRSKFKHYFDFSDFRLEQFAHCVTAMLGNLDLDRPEAVDLLAYFNFMDSIELWKKLTDDCGRSSFMIRHKSCGDRSATLLKQITVTFKNKYTILNQYLTPIMTGISEHECENLNLPRRFLFIEYRLYLFSDYLHGFVNLSHRLAEISLRGESSVDENTLVYRWLYQVVNAVAYLHERNIPHGNLKLENVLINENHLIKLTDFGIFHELELDQPIQNENERLNLTETLTHQSTFEADVRSLGVLMYKCLTLDRYETVDLEKVSPTKSRLKTILTAIIHPPVGKSFTLNALKTSLFYTLFRKLSSTKCRTVIEIGDKVRTLAGRADDFLFITCKRRRSIAYYNCFQLKKGAKSALKFNFTSSLATNFLSVNCNCMLKMGLYNKDLLSNLSPVPKFICPIKNNYLIGISTDNMFLIDENLKYVRCFCLLEVLEMKEPVVISGNLDQSAEEPEVPTGHRKSIVNTNRHSSMVNKFHLKLEALAFCYDPDLASAYLLVSVHGQICILNTFSVELNVLKEGQVEFGMCVKSTHSLSFNNGGSSGINASSSNVTTASGSSKNSTVAMVSGEKWMVCNEKYLFMCDVDDCVVRVFAKQTVRYLFNLDDRPSASSEHGLMNNRIKQICTDKRGFLYVVGATSISVFDPDTCDLMWKHDSHEIGLNVTGELSHLAFNLDDTVALVTHDDKNDGLNRIYVYE